ncbi:1-phosphofructokinase [Allofournierella sp.]|uniref:1-phosphofructokinase n=1 Tax=Allofournierella sp. TaxID=1940256 RepID=UPI002E78136D|nr:1-phosphofructokinase [Fournierella sp.]MEE0755681.1 1-phosphofructokinase [Fournierella sp.]
MIYTVTFNPALDYVVRLPAFEPGAVNRTESEDIQLGGKGINVSCVLGQLGVQSVALGFVAGFTGAALEEGLARRGVRADFIRLPEGLTRINVKIKASVETEINGQGPAIPAGALEELFRKLERLAAGDVLVLAGSIPASLPSDIYQRILERLAPKGVLCAVDATGELLVKVLPYKPFLIKPNNHELGEIFGRTLSTDEEIVECARLLQQKGARNVLVSMAGDGALLLDEGGNVHRLEAFKGKVKNSVGAGDSMVAGFVAGWLEKGDYAWALRLGSACGSATAFSDTLATRTEIESLLNR